MYSQRKVSRSTSLTDGSLSTELLLRLCPQRPFERGLIRNTVVGRDERKLRLAQPWRPPELLLLLAMVRDRWLLMLGGHVSEALLLAEQPTHWV